MNLKSASKGLHELFNLIGSFEIANRDNSCSFLALIDFEPKSKVD